MSKPTTAINSDLSEEQRYETLSPRQRKYWDVMSAISGVAYIKSKPGLAKSSIVRSIAEKMGCAYMDIRLSMIDETDMGLFPYLEDNKEYNSKLMSHAIPKWAYLANTKPTIIHFEELNRAPLAVRNAALQILLEREIGTEFAFNDNVFMIASGNLGEEDGTDVEEFDSALNNRLWHFKHELEVKEWLTEFAKLENPKTGRPRVNSFVTGYLNANPEEFYRAPTEKGGISNPAYATPRSWTFLSDLFEKKLNGESLKIEKVREVAQNFASNAIGNSAVKFLRYLDETMALNILDVLNNYKAVESRLKKANRDKKSELMESLKEMDVTLLKEHQIENLLGFFDLLDEDEVVGYMTHIVDKKNSVMMKTANVRRIFGKYKNLLVKIRSLS